MLSSLWFGQGPCHTSIACTGNPYCNFAVGRTKPKLAELTAFLDARYGARIDGLRLHLDGCPHACGQHWVGDIGVQGTTTRRDGARVEAYDIYLRGALGGEAAVGKAVLRKVPDPELEAHLARLLDRWLAEREGAEPLGRWVAGRSDEELKTILRGEAATTEEERR